MNRAGKSDVAGFAPTGRTIRVLFVVPHPIEGPSSRFRVYQFLPYLRSHGVDAVVAPLLPSSLAPIVYQRGRLAGKVGVTALAAARRVFDLLSSMRFDVVYILREAFPFGPPVLERLMKALAGKLILDFDDAIYVPSTAYTNPLDRFRDWTKTQTLIAMANHVVVGSRYLADFASSHAQDESRISVLPTVVDSTIFQPSDSMRSPKHFTIGWIGTPRGTAYLHPLRDAMKALSDRLPTARFVFVGAEPFDCGGLPVEFRPWRLDREVADIQSFDAGIMPLPDDEEARGKCGFKIIEYMSAGVAVVCSPVGANLEIVENGRSGLFAETTDEWTQALLSIASDASLRNAMTEAGRRRVEEHFCLDIIAPRLRDVLWRTVEASSRVA